MLIGPSLLDAAAVDELLPRIDALSVMRRMFLSLSEGQAVQPSQTLTPFPGGGGDFITYLGVLESAGVFGGKLSPYIVRQDGAVVTAWTLLMSMDTGQPLLLCDASRLTTERTAATTALAVSLLAKPAAKTLAIIGSGAVAQAHWRQTRDVRAWNDVRVYSPSLYTNALKRAAFGEIDARARVVTSLHDAVHDADVVMLCTSSATAVLDPRTLAIPALITSISTNAPRAHEIPPAALLGMDVYCDEHASTPMSAGEMVVATQEHGWLSTAIVGDLAALVSGKAPLPTYDRHVFFRSIGLGLEDVAMAHAIYELLQHDTANS
jgi:L-arginine dehydrogenase